MKRNRTVFDRVIEVSQTINLYQIPFVDASRILFAGIVV
jgi:hypothetical protein